MIAAVFLSESTIYFSVDVFRVFYKKVCVCVGGGLLNERENVGLNLGAGVDCDRFWSCDELGGHRLVFRWKETLFFLGPQPGSTSQAPQQICCSLLYLEGTEGVMVC